MARKDVGIIGCKDCIDWMQRFEVLQDMVIELTTENIELYERVREARNETAALRALGLWQPEAMDG